MGRRQQSSAKWRSWPAVGRFESVTFWLKFRDDDNQTITVYWSHQRYFKFIITKTFDVRVLTVIDLSFWSQNRGMVSGSWRIAVIADKHRDHCQSTDDVVSTSSETLSIYTPRPEILSPRKPSTWRRKLLRNISVWAYPWNEVRCKNWNTRG